MDENPYKSPETSNKRGPLPLLRTTIIVIALIGIAVALLLPALQMPREQSKPPFPRMVPRSLNDPAEPPTNDDGTPKP